ncbi:MAG TPA: hypothetical protein VGQ11_10205 [Candidatus Acidoferrales bacterium]|nr:hypothetical protein [Candidatus Acidoferrales bacterium]
MGQPILSIALPLLFVWGSLLVTFWLLDLLPIRPPAGLSKRIDGISTFELVDLGALTTGRLLLISAVSLFFELMLIRWLSSEIRIFAYFKNIVLVACFFGFGLGCFLSRKKIRLAYVLLPLLVLVLFTSLPWYDLHRLMLKLSDYIGAFADVHVFGRFYGQGLRKYAGAMLGFSVVIPCLALATLTMIPMGQLVSRFLEIRAGISAYSANVAASIVGIWLFTGLSFLATPPIVWFAVFALGMLAVVWNLPRFRVPVILTFVLIGVALWSGGLISYFRANELYGAAPKMLSLQVAEEKTYWSPYQKLTLVTLTDGKETIRTILQTNGSWYQDILDLRPDWVSAHPGYDGLGDQVPLPYHRYNFPYRFKPTPADVLILGAGMGNDVAAAIRNGAGRVVAVEIDPLIQQLGYERNPEKVYSDPRVVRVVNDARAYLQTTHEKFDLVVSSILDSHITQSSFTNIRTDNYVYTREGIEAMFRVLKSDGVLSVSFSDERPWFGGRMRDTLAAILGKTPRVLNNGYFFFIIGDAAERQIAADPELAAYVAKFKIDKVQDAALTTDDWPYFYQRNRGVPMIVAVLSVLLIALCWLVLRGNQLRLTSMRWHFFFLGAGFMLMEVQIISKLALVFGTTWLVNSIAISALLGLILLANAVASRAPALTGTFAYAGLFVALAVCYLVPMKALLFGSFWMRALASTLLLCSPVFFAGLIFISSFAASKFSAEAFGSNLFGSVVGGLLEALSFWTGIRSLLIVAGICYALSLMTRKGLEAEPVMKASAAAPAAAAD